MYVSSSNGWIWTVRPIPFLGVTRCSSAYSYQNCTSLTNLEKKNKKEHGKEG